MSFRLTHNTFETVFQISIDINRYIFLCIKTKQLFDTFCQNLHNLRYVLYARCFKQMTSKYINAAK